MRHIVVIKQVNAPFVTLFVTLPILPPGRFSDEKAICGYFSESAAVFMLLSGVKVI
jgi:hypothetical protein